ncbi:hypothetical protein SKAU_G00089370 [Synaphobranchus kaupii]|uniref:Uncharacterized protein n=1 Tax=Synaphobranchus kaupii TaxID=118154 RepID=A0A9Q1FWX9_SYNKA|nr:hypothetical protein SKAU_G00089370 [Synaphobranchus kaupii]
MFTSRCQGTLLLRGFRSSKRDWPQEECAACRDAPRRNRALLPPQQATHRGDEPLRDCLKAKHGSGRGLQPAARRNRSPAGNCVRTCERVAETQCRCSPASCVTGYCAEKSKLRTYEPMLQTAFGKMGSPAVKGSRDWSGGRQHSPKVPELH